MTSLEKAITFHVMMNDHAYEVAVSNSTGKHFCGECQRRFARESKRKARNRIRIGKNVHKNPIHE